MTIIKIHGLLAKDFGQTIKIHLGKINDIVNAIDAIKNGFRKKINELSKKNFFYVIQKDKKNNVLHILPIINGSGRQTLSIVFSVVLIVIGIVLMFTGNFAIGASFISMGFGMLGKALSAGEKVPVPNILVPNKYVGGATISVGDSQKSYVFDNAANIASQGDIVNFGYGKMKIGSNTIGYSVKSFPTMSTFLFEGSYKEKNIVSFYD